MSTDPEEDFEVAEEEAPLLAAIVLALYDLAGAAWRRLRGQREPHIGTLSNEDIDGLEPVSTRRT